MHRTTAPRALAILLLASAATATATARADVLASPTAVTRAHLSPDLKLKITTNAGVALEPSTLSFSLDGTDLLQGATITHTQPYAVDETYPWRGAHSTAVNRCNGLKLTLKHPTGQLLTLDLRAYDDGVAYRFAVPAATDSNQPRTPEEASALVIPAGSTVWHHDLVGHYEGVHTKTPIPDLKPGTWIAPPMTVKLPDNRGYLSVTEADLVDYPGMVLQAAADRTIKTVLAHHSPPSYPYTLRYSPEDVKASTTPARIAGPITTPWRVILVGPDLNTLVNADVVHNLCPPPDPKLFPQGLQTDWIKPGRAVWRYLDGTLNPQTGQVVQPPPRATTPASTAPPAPRTLDPGADAPTPQAGSQRSAAPGTPSQAGSQRSGGPDAPPRPATRRSGGGPHVSPDEIKLWSKLAHELTFEHNILEGFWRNWSEAELKDVCDDAAAQNVKIWIWAHSKDFKDPAKREAFWAMCNRTGVAGAKIDFFDTEAKTTIDLYQTIMKEAAEHHLMTDFHGANKPTGLTRTYPSALVYEAVKGMESSRVTNRAQHETTIPFTRCLAGGAEYTVCHLGNRRADTTVAHQVASAAILDAPLLTYSGNPRTLLDCPAADVIKSIPATWDQTIVLKDSEIGELAAYARRTGDTWFLAVMNGPAAKSIKVPLNFLPPGDHPSIAVTDTTDPAEMRTEQLTARSTDTLTLDLPAGGGYIARFGPAAK